MSDREREGEREKPELLTSLSHLIPVCITSLSLPCCLPVLPRYKLNSLLLSSFTRVHSNENTTGVKARRQRNRVRLPPNVGAPFLLFLSPSVQFICFYCLLFSIHLQIVNEKREREWRVNICEGTALCLCSGCLCALPTLPHSIQLTLPLPQVFITFNWSLHLSLLCFSV